MRDFIEAVGNQLICNVLLIARPDRYTVINPFIKCLAIHFENCFFFTLFNELITLNKIGKGLLYSKRAIE